MNNNGQNINKLNVVNINKNKKYKVERKKTLLRIITGIGALITLITLQIGYKKYKEYENLQAQTAIVEQYGQESIEKNIFDYIMLSENLHKLNLGNYEISNELIEECDIPKKLLSPIEIQELINNFNNQKFYIPNQSIDKDYNRVVLIAKLIYQEKLVNQYIYNEGYNYAHKNITTAAKEYVGEIFGVDPSSITFEYHVPKNGQEEAVTIKLSDENGNIINSYFVSGWSNIAEKNNIKNSVSYMDMTDKRFDKNNNDNDVYNKNRNVRIINSLKLSSNLLSKINNNDLYNENLSEKLTEKSK